MKHVGKLKPPRATIETKARSITRTFQPKCWQTTVIAKLHQLQSKLYAFAHSKPKKTYNTLCQLLKLHRIGFYRVAKIPSGTPTSWYISALSQFSSVSCFMGELSILPPLKLLLGASESRLQSRIDLTRTQSPGTTATRNGTLRTQPRCGRHRALRTKLGHVEADC